MAELILPDEGCIYDSMGDTMRVLLTSRATQGEFTLIEDRIKPGFHATLHLHREHSETFYIVEGEVLFTIDTQHVVARSGATVRVPANTPHEARSEQSGKMLTIFSPAGLEGALEALSELTPEQAENTSLLQSITNRFDIIDLAQQPIPTLVNFYELLLHGEANALLDLFEGEPKINTPQQGEVEGQEAFRRFVANQQAFLTTYHAQPHFFNTLLTPDRIVVEFIIDMAHNGETFDLPVAVMFERSGSKISGIRVYHSMWPLTGKHLLRPPLLPPTENLEEPALIQTYMQAILEPDEELVLSLFTTDAYLREPSGSRYKHAGPPGRKAFYNSALRDGGIMLHHSTATFDGKSFAVEYVCDQWGKTTFAPQAGMAVYEFADSDHLRAVRIYDDVTPPEEATS